MPDRPEFRPAIRSHALRWRGLYRGVSFEVVKWCSTEPDGEPYDSSKYGLNTWTWCYYVTLSEEQIPDAEVLASLRTELEKICGRQHRTYSDWMEGLTWHGGMTHYAIRNGNGEPFVFEGGCDYAHLCDQA